MAEGQMSVRGPVSMTMQGFDAPLNKLVRLKPAENA
jgi:hypothetical protein